MVTREHTGTRSDDNTRPRPGHTSYPEVRRMTPEVTANPEGVEKVQVQAGKQERGHVDNFPDFPDRASS